MNKMKSTMAAIALAFASSQAGAFNVDTLLGFAELGNSGDAAEEAALEALLGGTDVVLDIKVENANLVAQADGANWFIDVDPDTPGYFILKFGTGGTGIDADTYFFQNLDEFTKLVWTNEQVNFLSGGGGCTNCNIGRLSHYTTFNGTGDDGGVDGGDGGLDDGGVDGGDGGLDDGGTLPEPGSLGLIGLALAGLALGRRRKQA